MQTNTLTASILVVGYNSMPYIDACLRSLEDQDFPREAYEIIYADNASPDAAADHVAVTYPNVRLLRLQANHGFADGNNRAAQIAHGRYWVLVNQDTVAHRGWLRALVETMQANPQLGAAHSNQIVPLNREFNARDRVGEAQRTNLLNLARCGYVEQYVLPPGNRPIPTLFMSGGSCVVDSHVIDELGFLFDADYHSYAEDIDLSLRINARGYEIALIPDSIVYHDIGSGAYTPDATALDGALKSVRLASRVMHNEFITYWKNMYSAEFLLYLPFLLFGSALKGLTVPGSLVQRLLATAALVPITFVGFFDALRHFPDYRERRKAVLAKRKRIGRFWLFNALVRRTPALPSPRRRIYGMD